MLCNSSILSDYGCEDDLHKRQYVFFACYGSAFSHMADSDNAFDLLLIAHLTNTMTAGVGR